jgi:hypothetical protein
MPDDVEIIAVNGFANPWQYHRQVALDCDYLVYNLSELLVSQEDEMVPALFDQVYNQLPPIPDGFYFKNFPVPGRAPSAWNTRCMFQFSEWHEETANPEDVEDQAGTEDPDADEMEDDDMEETGFALPGPVEDKINASLWPFAQVVLQNLAILYQNLRIMAMVRLKKHPAAIPVNDSFISHSGLVPFYEMIDGPVEAPQHTIGIPFPSKN